MARATLGLAEAAYAGLLALGAPLASLWLAGTWGWGPESFREDAHPMEASSAAGLLVMGIGLYAVIALGTYVALRMARGRRTALTLLTIGGGVSDDCSYPFGGNVSDSSTVGALGDRLRMTAAPTRSTAPTATEARAQPGPP
jgi:hypothetical protein